MNKIRKNKKGFTLIELIVVIVIIAILIAALTPAILGVIDRANRVSDEAEARTVMSAATVAAMNNNYDSSTVTRANVIAQITGTPPSITGTIYWDGPVAVGFQVTKGKSKNNPVIVVGASSSSLTLSY